LQGLVDGLTGKKRAVVPAFLTFGESLETSENAGYELGDALRNLGSGLGQVASSFTKETGEGSGLIKFLNLLTDITNALDNLLGKINTVLSPLAKVIELSQRFAETESQRRIDFSPTVPNLPSVGSGRVPSVVINNNIKTAVDPQATARAIVKVTNTALSTTGISFIRPQFR
jgi:hypothetical protein